MGCPSENDLAHFVGASLSDKEFAPIEEHLASCDLCREVAFALTSKMDMLNESDTQQLDSPEMLGRFVMDCELGRGAMGVVYLARDPSLDRNVAIKVLRGRSKLGAEASERLQREAQGLARLTDRNVVSVHEAGSHDGRAYLVMEYVEGLALDAWLAKRPEKSEILRVMRQAGSGLAAVPRAGLVHRDFKPGNVLVPDNGEAKVADFGLVRRSEDTKKNTEEAEPLEVVPVQLSQTGAMIGTPAYMAPEQLLGGEATPRSDQFSFCVVLYEALYGERPFRGASFSALRDAMAKGAVCPKAEGVPRVVRQTMLRGLSLEPSARFASMAALLLDLEPRGKRLALVGGVGLAAICTMYIATINSDSKDNACLGFEERTEMVWSTARQEQIRDAFLASEAPYAENAWRGVKRIMEDRVQEWVTVAEGACKAGLRKAESPNLIDRRALCLERRLSETEQLLLVFSSAGDSENAEKDPENKDAAKKVVERAQEATLKLEDVSSCSDVEALMVAAALPTIDKRERVANLEAKLDGATGLHRTGRTREANEIVLAAEGEARALEYPPALARTLALKALLAGELGEGEGPEKPLFEVIQIASDTNQDALVAQAWLSLVYDIGYRKSRLEEGHVWARAADAAILRAGNPPRLRAAYHMNVSSLLSEQGKLEEALVELQAGLALRIQNLGPEHLETASSYNNLAALQQKLEDYESAKVSFAKALGIWRLAHGDVHPDVAIALTNLGLLATDLGQAAEAIGYLEEALPVWEKTMGETHVNVGVTLENMGLALVQQGRYKEAEDAHDRALSILREKLGDDHPRVAYSMVNRARARAKQGHTAGALEDYRSGRTLLAKTLGPGHYIISRVLVLEGTLQAKEGFPEEAHRLFLEALEIAEANTTEDNGAVGLALLNLGELALDRGQLARAQERFARAKPLFPAGSTETMHALAGVLACAAKGHGSVDPDDVKALETELASSVGALSQAIENPERFAGEAHNLAFAEFALAQTLPASEIGRARALAEHAATLLSSFESRRAQREEIHRWIAAKASKNP